MNVPFKKKSLDSILSSFTKVVDDLKVLQERNRFEIAENESKIRELEHSSLVLSQETEKAASIEGKINSLMS